MQDSYPEQVGDSSPLHLLTRNLLTGLLCLGQYQRQLRLRKVAYELGASLGHARMLQPCNWQFEIL